MKVNLYQINRFILSGGSATLLHYSVMAFLIFIEVKPIYATTIGALSGAIFNYFLQYHYTFKSDKAHLHAISIYSMAAALGFVSNAVLFLILHDFLENGVIISQLITTLIVTVQNYLVYKNLVFFSKETK